VTGDHYGGTRQGERFCGGESDATGRPSDKCYFSLRGRIHCSEIGLKPFRPFIDLSSTLTVKTC